jgi:hypothetical protein
MPGRSKFLLTRQWSLKTFKQEGFDYPYSHKETEASNLRLVKILSADS